MLHFFVTLCNTKYEVEKVSIWQHFLINAHTFFNICVLSFPNKKLHYNRAGQQFFNAPCNRVTIPLQKRKRHKSSLQSLVVVPCLTISSILLLLGIWIRYVYLIVLLDILFRNLPML